MLHRQLSLFKASNVDVGYPSTRISDSIAIMKRRTEKGSMTLIEAVIVFPVTFIVVFLILMMGNVYYQRAAVERGVIETALHSAACSENPMMAYILTNKAVPTGPSDTHVMPYRYLFTKNIKEISGEQEDRLNRYIKNVGKMSFFKGLKPKVNECSVKPSVNLIFSQVEVMCDFNIQLPLRMIFSTRNFEFNYRISMTEQIGDSAAYVRNAAMIRDYLERNETVVNAASTISEKLGKVKDFLN